MDQEPKDQTKKWYKTTGGTIALLIFFFPIGVYLMWKYTSWNKIVKWIITAIFVFILLTSVLSGRSSQNTTSTQSTTTGSNNEAKPTPTVEKINARDLADDFDSNQVAAEAKWKDKLVEFSAQISNITDSGILFTDVASKQFSFTKISCRVQDKQQLLPLKNGQTVTIKGVVGSQIFGGIEVKNCEVVQ